MELVCENPLLLNLTAAAAVGASSSSHYSCDDLLQSASLASPLLQSASASASPVFESQCWLAIEFLLLLPPDPSPPPYQSGLQDSMAKDKETDAAAQETIKMETMTMAWLLSMFQMQQEKQGASG